MKIRGEPATCLLMTLLALGSFVPGCASDPTAGYAWTSTYASDIHSVSVPVFGNQTHATGLETQLTEAVVKQIQRTTPWVVTRGRSADTTLQGTITEVEFDRLSTGPGSGLVQEQAVHIEIRFDWVDNRTGETLLSRERFRAVSVFVPSLQTGERAEIGQRGAIQELAEDIVAELRRSW
ncbi:MAG: hypothetical protein D6695_00060 [Planctomycetota bacterium]|nr:MAG: hypothetical protein D6695_00060 [Planctomycetota bacterium]